MNDNPMKKAFDAFKRGGPDPMKSAFDSFGGDKKTPLPSAPPKPAEKIKPSGPIQN